MFKHSYPFLTTEEEGYGEKEKIMEEYNINKTIIEGAGRKGKGLRRTRRWKGTE
jgi:hypothetical protein